MLVKFAFRTISLKEEISIFCLRIVFIVNSGGIFEVGGGGDGGRGFVTVPTVLSNLAIGDVAMILSFKKKNNMIRIRKVLPLFARSTDVIGGVLQHGEQQQIF